MQPGPPTPGAQGWAGGRGHDTKMFVCAPYGRAAGVAEGKAVGFCWALLGCNTATPRVAHCGPAGCQLGCTTVDWPTQTIDGMPPLAPGGARRGQPNNVCPNKPRGPIGHGPLQARVCADPRLKLPNLSMSNLDLPPQPGAPPNLRTFDPHTKMYQIRPKSAPPKMHTDQNPFGHEPATTH